METMKSPQKEEVIEQLRKGVVHVNFEKADGTSRWIAGTLMEAYIPVDQTPKGVKKANPDVQTIYDTVDKCWKSFRWDRLKSVSTTGSPIT